MPAQGGSRGIAVWIFGILAVLAGLATVEVASLALQRFHAHPDEGWIAVGMCVVPGLATVGFGLATALLVADRRQKQAIATRQALNPDQPWLWFDEWRQGWIRAARESTAATLLIVFAVVWNAVVVGSAFLVRQRPDALRTPGIWVFFFLFGLAGLFLVGLAIYSILLAMKYPPSVFEMSALPGTLGGRLAGSVRLPAKVPAGAEVRARLSCERKTSTSSRQSSWCLWQDEAHLRAPSAGSLAIEFTIPFDLPPSDLSDVSRVSWIRWLLSLSARVPGVDYSAVFHVPVFATADSDPSIRSGVVDAARPTGRPADAKSALVEASAERTVFAFGRVKGLGCGVSAFFLLPLLAWPISRSAGLDPVAALIAVGIALLVGAGFLALTCVGALLTATRLAIDSGAIRVDHGTWWLHWTRTIPLAEVTEVRYASAESQRVDAYTRTGSSYWISGDMSGPEEAKWLAEEVGRAVDRHRARP